MRAFYLFERENLQNTLQGVVTLIRTVEPSATGIKIFDRYPDLLIVFEKILDRLIFYHKKAIEMFV